MGLDILYYKGLKKADLVFDEDGEPIDPQTREPLEEYYFRAYAHPDFSDRADGLSGYYSYEESGGLHAGSYGGYNNWRENLAELVGYESGSYEQYGSVRESFAATAWEAESGPFFELICFSDCEGTIGPKTSAKLAKDFSEFQEKADHHPDERFRQKYAEWREAFEMAQQNGAVDFH